MNIPVFTRGSFCLSYFLTNTVGTTSVECSFILVKLVKMRLRRIMDDNFARLVLIVIKGSELIEIDFTFKNNIIVFYCSQT